MGDSGATGKPTPVTVFTGFLGAGKTTIINNLMKGLPEGYNCVWLKNEFGDLEVDSEVARDSHVQVREITNGCLCCVLVGQMNEALKEIVEENKPQRIIIETSGSAYPAPIAWEVRKMDFLHLDGIVTVIDAINFTGYDDKTYTARLQAQYTDLVLINKHELVSERELDKVMDEIYDLNPDTPKVKTTGAQGLVSSDLVFGLDTELFSKQEDVDAMGKDDDHHSREVDLLQVRPPAGAALDRAVFEEMLGGLPKDDVYRAKGLLRFSGDDTPYLMNWVFGRHTLEALPSYSGEVKFIFMGEQLKMVRKKVIKQLGLPEEAFELIPKAKKHDHGHADHVCSTSCAHH